MLYHIKRITYLILFVYLFQTALYAQKVKYTFKAVYKLEYSPDSTNMSQKLNEYCLLLINESGSMFLAERFLKMDSAKRAEAKKGNAFGPSMDWYVANATKYTTVVYKDYGKGTTESHQKLMTRSSDHYVYTETIPNNWELHQDTITIGKDLCYKATLNYGNRKWTAWYNPNVPIQDGPYKFGALPGLVYQIEDSTQSWSFKLVSFKEESSDFEFNCSDNNHITGTKEGFIKNRSNAYKSFTSVLMAKGAKMNLERIKEENDRNAKDNNWIELYP